MTPRRAVYEWGLLPGLVWITDLCHPHAPSVTNDAERVIEDLAAAGVDLEGNRVVYRDSTGRWDELLVKAGCFAGFAPIGTNNLRLANWQINGATP